MENIPQELYDTLDKWAEITIKELRASIRHHNIGKTGDLYRSFTHRIFYGADGMPSGVTIGFLMHGRFVDMGVGKGVKYENIKTNREIWQSLSRAERRGRHRPRKQTKWYTNVVFHQYQALSELLIRKYAITIPPRFENLLSGNI